MSTMTLGFRKLRLQRLQLKSLSDMKDSERYQEQKAVYNMLLTKPSVLFTDKRFDSNENRLYKYTNTLNKYAKNEKYYKEAVQFLGASR
ncbi:hypothetical protein VBH21_14230 [Enterococcus hirae]|uniref:hypothetical protein n=1 Tax=Enterococcus TaxID=1350 RepID=UPI0009BE4557|nr:hypothetical protein [Enterococcus hirae]EMF0042571.1 hypothetical protein [Enterococcus hirae]EMF0136952.1 hypothetical protein [Enterococcus hirae]EMF0511456.1 hypothetical protein [Enterococcus hirae]EMF0623191.1 hypothetical protein [Enterococcus hirae]OQO39839.1 hypothetical protein BH758_13540 [Enterococcus hirae]